MKILKLFTKIVCLSSLLAFCVKAKAQAVIAGNTNTNGSSTNAITTAVPFLTISPDARSGAMGDAGVAISPDVNTTYWNPAKLVYLESNTNLSLSYSPWLRNIVPDVNLGYLSFAKKIDERGSFGASLRYFNLGTIELFDANQNAQGTYKPNEFSIDASYARKFGDNFSMALTGRYIHSDLTNGIVNGSQTKAANGIAADVSLYLKNPAQQFGKDALFAFGVDISNIGPKLSYTTTGNCYFLPTNLKIGIANTWYLDDENEVTFAFDVNKLLVPTPPIRDANGNVISGKDDTNQSVVSGIFGSFTDAPGGFSEELKEINFAPAFEYWYNKEFALRAGYFYENPDKGNRQYFTLGAGFKYSDFKLDFSYLIASQNQSPLANTLRFSLGYNFGSK